jgi:hypothetical protein
MQYGDDGGFQDKLLAPDRSGLPVIVSLFWLSAHAARIAANVHGQ